MIELLASTILLGSVQKTYGWEDIVQSGLKDAKFVAVAVKGDQKELKKINDEFGQSYRFTKTTAYVKEPFMLRMEAEVEDAKLTYVMNGLIKAYKVGRQSFKQNVGDSPGKRQTIFDFGLMTPSLFKEFMVAKFIRVDREGELVFDITYNPKFDDTSRYRVWVDPVKKIMTQRVWFGQEGQQRATFIYENPKQQNGVWFPTRCTVKNVENKIAGITEYREMSINPGLSMDLFKT